MKEVKMNEEKLGKQKDHGFQETTAKSTKNILQHKNNRPKFPEKRKRNEEINKLTTLKSTKRG
jgi:hypothetical protein